ncbi:MAG: glycosyltransferase family 4 protein, partial [Bdellovibrionales bacterium]|nr:glycosyltransferase family 4 protein [Bdellovibrionales bacterium]
MAVAAGQCVEPLRVVLDARKLGDGGIGVYIENLIEGLLGLPDDGRPELSLIVNDEGDTSRWGSFVEPIVSPARKYSLDEYLVMPLRLRDILKRADVFHAPHYTLPYFLSVPAVTTIHDVIHLTHPDTVIHRPVARQLIGSALRRSAHVITVSEASRRTIEEQFSRAIPRMSVIPNALRSGIVTGVRSSDSAADIFGLSAPYVVFVGGERPHKGFRELLQATAELNQRRRERGLKELVIAACGDGFTERARSWCQELGLQGVVRFLDVVDERDLVILYRDAALTVVPSRAEGYGLVALEALWFACPTVCSPAPSLIEVCRDAGWFADDFSAASLSAAMEAALTNDLEREEKKRRGIERARLFTARRQAIETMRVYR